ncbi:MAG TPA: hypothetical protein VJM32_05395 [Candidatus Saccharimonadales bacterium]|nr:hypothetical protein [Candidatus Saccharimonadales bacterium]
MDTPEKKTASPTAGEPQKQEVKNADAQKRRAGTLVLVAGGLVILALGFGAGWLSRNETNDRLIGPGFAHKADVFEGSRPMMKQHLGGEDVNPTDGTEYSHLSGVVTQVNGDTFTIAGNGTTKTIKTNGSTTYNVTTNKVKVNDSVIVKGSKSGDTFTATGVSILNR